MIDRSDVLWPMDGTRDTCVCNYYCLIQQLIYDFLLVFHGNCHHRRRRLLRHRQQIFK